MIAKTLNQLSLTHAQELSIPKQASNIIVFQQRTNPQTESMSRICSRIIIKHHHGLEHTTLAPNLMNYSQLIVKYIINLKDGNINIKLKRERVKNCSRVVASSSLVTPKIYAGLLFVLLSSFKL